MQTATGNVENITTIEVIDEEAEDGAEVEAEVEAETITITTDIITTAITRIAGIIRPQLDGQTASRNHKRTITPIFTVKSTKGSRAHALSGVAIALTTTLNRIKSGQERKNEPSHTPTHTQRHHKPS